MPTFVATDPGYEARVRESFSRLALMRTIGASLVRVEPGAVDIEMVVRRELTQQHGYMAAGIVTAIVDIACGYAAMSLMPAGSGVVTVEYKVNFVTPARGERLLAQVQRQRRTEDALAEVEQEGPGENRDGDSIRRSSGPSHRLVRGEPDRRASRRGTTAEACACSRHWWARRPAAGSTRGLASPAHSCSRPDACSWPPSR